jgi:hypothetical protein
MLELTSWHAVSRLLPALLRQCPLLPSVPRYSIKVAVAASDVPEGLPAGLPNPLHRLVPLGVASKTFLSLH